MTSSPDAVRAAEVLTAQPEIDPQRLGAYSISAGGWFAPAVTAETASLAFWFAKVAPADSVWTQQVRLGEHYLRRSELELTEADIARGLEHKHLVQRVGWDAPRAAI